MKTAALAAACGALLGCAAETPADSAPGDAGTPPAPADAAPGTPDAAPGAPDAAPLDDGTSPPKPPGLVTWIVGDDDDAPVNASGPAILLEGGAFDVNEAFDWWTPLINQGDVIVLRTEGGDGYNDYIYQDGAVDSVETMLVTTRTLANSDYVAWRVAHAEAVFFAGGGQNVYLEEWQGTRLEDAMVTMLARGGAVGGTSAGCALLGQFIYSGTSGSIVSSQALDDPYDSDLTLVRDFLPTTALSGLITDTHFAARNRMGRLVAFVARTIEDGWVAATAARGLGIDESTAVTIDAQGNATVWGEGAAYLVVPSVAPTRCSAGQPLELTGLTVYELRAGQTFDLPAATASVAGRPLAATGGALQPANPY